MILAVLATCAFLSGSFNAVPGSPGAGNIVYDLRIHNGGTQACTLPGVPKLQLLGKRGKALPTKVLIARRRPVKTIVLQPGKTATAPIRFSPDVPPGCGLPAFRLRVATPAVTVRIKPVTHVCSRGLLQVTPFR